MGYGKSGMGGAHPIMKHMTKAGGGTGTSQSMSKNANIKYGGSVIDQFKSPMKNMYGDAPLEKHKGYPHKRATHKGKGKGGQNIYVDSSGNVAEGTKKKM